MACPAIEVIHAPPAPRRLARHCPTRVQRGNDRQPCFFTEADYLCYRSKLREIALREGCMVHAYVLMTNHVRLLLTPHRAGAVARTLQALGRRYVRLRQRYLWTDRHAVGRTLQGVPGRRR